MVNEKTQAIAGVSPGAEQILMVKYPSIACRWIGRILGRMCESVPQPKINGIKPSYLLFGPLAAPFALLGYIELKTKGNRYVLTNRSVQIWKALGSRMISQVTLADIEWVDVVQHPGQAFYKAADLNLRDASGKTIMRIESVVRAEVFKQNILEARDARREVESSLTTIQARQTA